MKKHCVAKVLLAICTVAHNCHDNNKIKHLKKTPSQIKKFYSYIKKVCFHINEIASEMVKTRGLISKTNISNISKISLSWNLTLIVFAVSIIQLPSRKGARHGFNMPNCYLQTKPNMNMMKNILTL